VTLIVSSLLMLFFFGIIVIAERKCSRRSKDFFKKSDAMISDLAQNAQEKYRARFGKDPTGKINTLTETPTKRHT
jgi:hypothetical protein